MSEAGVVPAGFVGGRERRTREDNGGGVFCWGLEKTPMHGINNTICAQQLSRRKAAGEGPCRRNRFGRWRVRAATRGAGGGCREVGGLKLRLSASLVPRFKFWICIGTMVLG